MDGNNNKTSSEMPILAVEDLGPGRTGQKLELSHSIAHCPIANRCLRAVMTRLPCVELHRVT